MSSASGERERLRVGSTASITARGAASEVEIVKLFLQAPARPLWPVRVRRLRTSAIRTSSFCHRDLLPMFGTPRARARAFEDVDRLRVVSLVP